MLGGVLNSCGMFMRMLADVYGAFRRLSDGVYLVLLVVINGISGLLVVPILLRRLSPESLGVVSAAMAIGYLFQSLVENGCNIVSTRMALGGDIKTRDLSGVIDRSLVLKLIVLVLILIAILPVVVCQSVFSGYKIVVVVLLLNGLLTGLNSNWAILCVKKAGVLLIIGIITRATLLVFVYFGVDSGGGGEINYAIWLSVASLLGVILPYVYLCYTGLYAFGWVEFRLDWVYIKNCFAVYSGSVADNLLYGLTPVLYGRIAGVGALSGIYIVDKLRGIVSDVVGNLTRVFLVDALKSRAERRARIIYSGVAVIVVVSTCLGVTIALGANRFVCWVAGGSRPDIVPWVTGFAPVAVVMLLGTAVMMIFLAGKGKYFLFSMISIASVLLGFVVIIAFAGSIGYRAVLYGWMSVYIVRLISVVCASNCKNNPMSM